jgi:hypothetical protein
MGANKKPIYSIITHILTYFKLFSIGKIDKRKQKSVEKRVYK